MDNEMYKINGCSKYLVCRTGRIWNVRLKRFVKSTPCRLGYHRVWLTDDNGKRFSTSIHRVVAQTFIDNPDNKSDVNHKDGNKSNNQVSNLEWNTRSENILHAHQNNLIKPAKKKARNKAIVDLRNYGYTFDEIGDAFNISKPRAIQLYQENK